MEIRPEERLGLKVVVEMEFGEGKSAVLTTKLDALTVGVAAEDIQATFS